MSTCGLCEPAVIYSTNGKLHGCLFCKTMPATREMRVWEYFHSPSTPRFLVRRPYCGDLNSGRYCGRWACYFAAWKKMRKQL